MNTLEMWERGAEAQLTIGELYRPAMDIEDPEEAERYFGRLVNYQRARWPGKSRAEHEVIMRSNLGYYAGYYDRETRIRVERLFRCAHPAFGSAAAGTPTAQEAFEMGRKYGERANEQESG